MNTDGHGCARVARLQGFRAVAPFLHPTKLFQLRGMHGVRGMFVPLVFMPRCIHL